MNPFSWTWNIVSTMFRFVLNPKELGSAMVDPKIQAVYHLSSIYTAVSIFLASLAYPEWARVFAENAVIGLVSGWRWMSEGPVGVATRELWAMACEFFWGSGTM